MQLGNLAATPESFVRFLMPTQGTALPSPEMVGAVLSEQWDTFSLLNGHVDARLEVSCESRDTRGLLTNCQQTPENGAGTRGPCPPPPRVRLHARPVVSGDALKA